MKRNKVLPFLMALFCVGLFGSCATSKLRLPEYDVRPENRPPGMMTRAASPDYSIDNEHTFPIYKDPYIIDRPQGTRLSGGISELYRAKEATYLTFAYRIPEDWWFFCFYSGDMLIDTKTGDRYMMRGLEYYPTDTCFWINGSAGKYVRFVIVFPPLPKHVKEVDLFMAGGPSRFNFNGMAERIKGLRVEDLRPKCPIRQGRIIR